ncbi:hypothetical protein [Pleomorphovibrio marinus]|uniref:hypothetical protein n=1 Tax=Pleomorphovibrio marinus TaxID=2164132 RepID=UPI001E59E4C4|nr:hypothetical protein [Pleomorphovibrio marinus]
MRSSKIQSNFGLVLGRKWALIGMSFILMLFIGQSAIALVMKKGDRYGERRR